MARRGASACVECADTRDVDVTGALVPVGKPEQKETSPKCEAGHSRTIGPAIVRFAGCVLAVVEGCPWIAELLLHALPRDHTVFTADWRYHSGDLIALHRAPYIFRVGTRTGFLVSDNLLVADYRPGDEFMTQLAVRLDQGTHRNHRESQGRLPQVH